MLITVVLGLFIIRASVLFPLSYLSLYEWHIRSPTGMGKEAVAHGKGERKGKGVMIIQ